MLCEKQWLLRNLQDQDHMHGANAGTLFTVFSSFVNGGAMTHSTIQQGNLVIIFHDNLSQQQMMYSLWQH